MVSPKALDQYTVGWIAALPLELAAATAMLDEDHAKPLDFEKPSTDQNTYTWGRISGHNVVIASLPVGVYGEISAAVTAMSMLRSFPNIRVGLMVGIGAAISRPEQDRDIRLGDVVVSRPDGRTGGVLQYDFSKAKTGGKRELKGSLNMPPQALLTALAKLQAKHEFEPSKVPEFLEEMVKNYPLMAKSKPGKASYLYQGDENDRFFKAEYEHSNGRNCKDCDPQHEVPRENRDSKEPEIHYGIIASGNTLVKDAATRDLILQDTGEDCICLEMEAAGLMNNFPCLVIRGICDYADSHKNDRWQRYAAATSSAYAKEFLGFVDVVDLEKTQSAVDALKDIKKNMIEMRDGVNKLQLDSHQQKVSQWLSPPDPSANYKRALDQRHEGSGLWFIQSKNFTDWKAKSNAFLWLYGIAGCGKTILSSTIIEELNRHTSHSQTILYFYFDFNNTSKQSLEQMIRSLIIQLYDKREETRRPLDSLFSSCAEGRQQPTTESLRVSLLDMIQQVDRVYIVLDALDECNTRIGTRAKGLLSWMQDLITPEERNVHLLVTSRPEEDISSALNKWSRIKDYVPIQGDVVDHDIHAYIHASVRHGEGLQRWEERPEIQDEIETILKEKSNGMFRWAACQLDALEKCLEPPTLRVALASLPKTLDETYNRILGNIPSEYKQKAIRILQFLVFSKRPLLVKEAVDAITVEPDHNPPFDPGNRMPKPTEISRYCSSLVIVDNEQLQLAHFSVKEYLTSDRLEEDVAGFFRDAVAKGSIARVCLSYLLSLNQDLLEQEIITNFHLAQYCAQYWMSHAVAANNNKILQDLIIRFFLDYEWSYANCYQLYNPDRYSVPIIHGYNLPTPLYYASLGGLKDAVECLIERGLNTNAQGGSYGNALQAASAKGHEKIVQLLLQKDADVNAQGGWYGNALQAASAKGHEKIVQLLLQKDADVNAQGGYYCNALQAASVEGHEKIVQLLLQKDADVNAQGGYYCNALQAASVEGNEKIVQLLLQKDADVNAQGGDYGNALQAASVEGNEKIVQLLLQKDADVNAQGGYYGNALQAASAEGNEKIVQLLLQKDADVNAQGGHYGNALQAAFAEGHEKIVQLLLQKDADVNAQGGYYGNALQAAFAKGHEKIVQLLLQTDADVNAQGGYYGNALQAASAEGNEKIVQLLLQKDADVNAQGGHYGNALQAAFAEGHEKIVQLLLQKDVDVNAQGGHYGNALQAASARGHEKIVQLLLQKGADVNAQCGHYGNALQAASAEGHEKIAQLLLQKGAVEA